MTPSIVTSIEEIEKARATARSGFKLDRVSMAAAADQWSMIDGALQHKSRGFFSVVGVRDKLTGEQKLMLYQPQGAVTGFLTAQIGGERCYLLQSRAEPGNVDEVQFGPTIQSTPANYLKLHGGKSSPYADDFVQHADGIGLVLDTSQLDQGGRYAQKTKKVTVLETQTPRDAVPGFHWFSHSAISAAVTKSFCLNTDLKANLAVAPWSADPSDGELTPVSEAARQSLNAPIRGDVIGTLHARLALQTGCGLEFVRVEDLPNWSVTDDGLAEEEPGQNFTVGFFQVEASLREVKQWIQPLVACDEEGLALLACRRRGNSVEFYVDARREIGLPTGSGLLPSYLAYPGEAWDPPAWLAQHMDDVWLETGESDEGGRFHRHRSKYRLINVPDTTEAPADGTGAWLNLAELKHFLATSNVCAIQLRTMTATLLGAA